ncbi:TPA: helix-turn-helix domain-containing protein, partial [Klebsiella pneumoniae]
SVLKVMLALADEGDTLTPDALPEAYRAAPAPLPRGGLQAHDEQLIVDTLARVNGNVSRAAQILGLLSDSPSLKSVGSLCALPLAS